MSGPVSGLFGVCMITHYAAALTLSLLGCNQSVEQGVSDLGKETPRIGDDLVMITPFDPGNINPLVAPYQLSGMLADLVNPGLATRDIDETGLVYRPALAKSWTWADDGMSLEYVLRDDLMWSGGDMVRASDVVYTHGLMSDPSVGSNWLGDSKAVASVETTNVYQVRFAFKEPRNKLLQQGYTFRGVLSEEAFKVIPRDGLRGAPISRMPAASGPWAVAEWLPEDRIVFHANPQAPQSWRPKLNRLIVRIIPEYSTRLLELEQGKADLMPYLEVADVERLAGIPHLRIERIPSATMQYIGYNLTRDLFKDKRLRKALTLGLDRNRLIQDLLTSGDEQYGRTSVGTVSPAFSDWIADINPLPVDVAQAKALLESSGWSDSDSDGFVDKDGQPLAFGLLVQTGSDELKRIAVMSQAMWKDVGIRVDLEMVDPLQFTRRARAKEYDALLWSFGANPTVDPTIKWHTDGAYNWFGYSNSAVDEAIAAGVSSTDVSESQKQFRKVQRLVYEDQPATFLYWKDGLTAVDRRFENTSMNVFSVIHDLHRWDVRPDNQKYNKP